VKILKKRGLKDSEHKSVSVIIAARNEAKHLEKLIELLDQQNHPNYEVIIVNDRSSDKSRNILHKLESRYTWLSSIHIETLPQGWTGKKHAINKALEEAKNQVLLFTDADCIPNSKNWINMMTSGESDIKLGYSPYEIEPGLLNQFIQYETLMTGLQYLGFAESGKPYMAVGRNWSIQKASYPKNILESIKGFEGGDDDLILNHIGNSASVETVIDPSAQTISKPKSNWPDYLKQKIRHLSVGIHYNQKHLTRLGVFTLANVIGWFFFLIALILGFEPYIILIIFGLRSLSFYTIFTRVGLKLGTSPNYWALPLLDLCYSIYYPVIGISAWSAKNIKWS